MVWLLKDPMSAQKEGERCLTKSSVDGVFYKVTKPDHHLVRENIREKKLLPFGHFPKGGGGVQPESKSFEVVF